MEQVKNMQNERDSGQGEAVNLQRDARERGEEVNRLQEQIHMLESQIQTLSREKDLLKNSQSPVIEDNQRLTEQIQALHAKIRKLEKENLEISDHREDLKIEVERQARGREQLSAQLEKINGESFKFRSDVDTSQATRTRLESQLQELEKDKQILKNQIRDLETLLSSQKTLYAEADNKATE